MDTTLDCSALFNSTQDCVKFQIAAIFYREVKNLKIMSVIGFLFTLALLFMILLIRGIRRRHAPQLKLFAFNFIQNIYILIVTNGTFYNGHNLINHYIMNFFVTGQLCAVILIIIARIRLTTWKMRSINTVLIERNDYIYARTPYFGYIWVWGFVVLNILYVGCLHGIISQFFNAIIAVTFLFLLSAKIIYLRINSPIAQRYLKASVLLYFSIIYFPVMIICLCQLLLSYDPLISRIYWYAAVVVLDVCVILRYTFDAAAYFFCNKQPKQKVSIMLYRCLMVGEELEFQLADQAGQEGQGGPDQRVFFIYNQ